MIITIRENDADAAVYVQRLTSQLGDASDDFEIVFDATRNEGDAELTYAQASRMEQEVAEITESERRRAYLVDVNRELEHGVNFNLIRLSVEVYHHHELVYTNNIRLFPLKDGDRLWSFDEFMMDIVVNELREIAEGGQL